MTTEKTFIYGPHISSENAISEYSRLVFGERRVIQCRVNTPAGLQFKFLDGLRWYLVTVADNYQGWNVEVTSEG